MIDWHSHILPHMDDGSRDVAESVSLLKMLKEQGVDTVVATPHFYANDDTVESFLSRRAASYAELEKELSWDAPKILLGAEVKYYPGISRMEGLKQLKLEGSQLLLLEMPMSRWTDYTVREVMQLAALGSFTVVLAHIERYLALQSRGVWEKLYREGVLMQVNASFFTEFFTRRNALDKLMRGEIHFVGSDCHNLTTRPPKMGKAFEIIRKKLGDDFICQMNGYGKTVLAKNI